MEIGRACNVGRVRKLNEDSLLCLQFEAKFHQGDESAGLFVVADGMGGHNAGEIASECGIKTFVRECVSRLFAIVDQSVTKDDDALTIMSPDKILNLATNEANNVLFEMSQQRQVLHGMGTTITAALITGRDLYISHVGDSRCYVINERETVQITKDHSLVQEMVDAGLLTSEEARTHPKKNVITRVVGYYQEIEVDNEHYQLFQGDNILLCSDGLWGVLDDKRITEIVLTADTPQQACDELVAQANELGGPDNISVIIVKPQGLPSWQELLTADTQVRRAPEIAPNEAEKPHGGLLSFLRRKIASP